MIPGVASELPFFQEPRSDNEQLLNLQHDYKTGDKEALTKMYIAAKRIALKIINNKAKKNKHVAALCREERLEKAHDAAAYLITQYTNRPDFIITGSCTGYLYLRVMHELFYHRKSDKLIVYMDMERIRK